ncbi:MAG TPA: hypothetical protein VHN36_03650 [Ilumatobacteraceae bacterium]|jgi:hypothetical protein|nr:hypothetical protein [Ilumatobacteraceae bacterium]
MSATESSRTTHVRLTLSADGERQAPEGVGDAGVALFVVALLIRF